MLTTMRNRFGPVFVTLIIGGIAGVFILSDFISPRAGRGMGAGASGSHAGEVNGETISIADYNRELSRRVEAMKQFTGGKITDEQLKMFRVREAVFNELAQRRLILQDCIRSGRIPSDVEVMARIRELPYFQKDGKFDLTTYRNLLAGNNLTAGGFEKMIREDLTLQGWSEGLKSSVRVSDDEVEREFRVANDKRNIKYVVFDAETGRRAVSVEDSEVDSFLKDPAKVARARGRFEAVKDTQFKGSKFEQVQKQVARDVLAGEKSDAIREANIQAAERVLPLLGKAPDSKVNELLKPLGAAVKSSGLVARQGSVLQGLGEAPDLMADAFQARSPIHPGSGGKAKKYISPAWVAVAVVAEVQRPDLSKLTAEKAKLEQQIRMRKERVLEEEWVGQLRSKAKIEMNPDLIQDSPET
jgi:peptidyl-prolyl cis-trans isomerase D